MEKLLVNNKLPNFKKRKDKNFYRFEIRKKPFNSERHPTTGIGGKVDIHNEMMY